MVYRELVEYIKGTRAKGYSDDLIGRALAAKGWARHDVKAAYDLVEQEKFLPLQGEEAKTRQEIVLEKQAEAQQEKIVSKGFSSSAAWIRCISAPQTAFTNARYFASYGKAAASLAGAYLFAALAFLAVFFAGGSQLLAKLPESVSGALLGMGALFALGFTIAGLVSWLLQAALLNLAVWLPAKHFFSGKASFAQQLYVSSIAFGAGFLLFIAAFGLSAASQFFETPGIPPFYLGEYSLPVISLAASVIALFALAYSAFLHIKAVKVAHEFGYGKAVASILVGAVAMALLTALVLGAVLAAVAGSFLSGLGVTNEALAAASADFGFGSFGGGELEAGGKIFAPTPGLEELPGNVLP